MPLRAAQAKLAVLTAYADREELGDLAVESSAKLNDDRLELLQAIESLSADISGEPDPVARSEDEKRISLRQLAEVLADAVALLDETYATQREKWFERLLGPERDAAAGLGARRVHAPAVAARRHLHEGHAPPRSASTR